MWSVSASSTLPNEDVEVNELLTPPTLSILNNEPVISNEPVILWVSSNVSPNCVEPLSTMQ